MSLGDLLGEKVVETYSHDKLRLSIPLDSKDVRCNHHNKSQGNPSSRISILVPERNNSRNRRQLSTEQHSRGVEISPSECKTECFIDVTFGELEDRSTDWEISGHFPDSQVTRPDESDAVGDVT